jgi:hypothetical protein
LGPSKISSSDVNFSSHASPPKGACGLLRNDAIGTLFLKDFLFFFFSLAILSFVTHKKKVLPNNSKKNKNKKYKEE